MEETTILEAFEAFKPESCVFVISTDVNGRPSGMIAGWNMKCSLDPPLYAVALSKQGYTHKLIRQSREFVIAVPNQDLEKALKLFGSTHGDETDKFRETGIEIEKGKYVRSPLIKNATINFECVLENEIESGDHIIFIGRILRSCINQNKKILFNLKKLEGRRIYQEL